jgi:hypothetical protein
MRGYEGLKDSACMSLKDIVIEVRRVVLLYLVLGACQI